MERFYMEKYQARSEFSFSSQKYSPSTIKTLLVLIDIWKAQLLQIKETQNLDEL